MAHICPDCFLSLLVLDSPWSVKWQIVQLTFWGGLYLPQISPKTLSVIYHWNFWQLVTKLLSQNFAFYTFVREVFFKVTWIFSKKCRGRSLFIQAKMDFMIKRNLKRGFFSRRALNSEWKVGIICSNWPKRTQDITIIFFGLLKN